MVFIISSVTGLDLGILQHHRRHLFVNFRKMVHAILLTDSSSEKPPAARWGNPEDLMGPAVFLASDASDFVNGHILYVDGGILAYIGKQP